MSYLGSPYSNSYNHEYDFEEDKFEDDEEKGQDEQDESDEDTEDASETDAGTNIYFPILMRIFWVLNIIIIPILDITLTSKFTNILYWIPSIDIGLITDFYAKTSNFPNKSHYYVLGNLFH